MQFALSEDAESSDNFIFNIARVIKRFYKSPVILMLKQDYASNIFNFLVDMRAALQEENSERIIEIITKFHHEWLEAVNQVLEFKLKIRCVPRENVFKAIVFTMECGDTRRKQFQKFIDQSALVMTTSELDELKREIGSIKDLEESLNSVLRQKQDTLKNFAYSQDFYNQVDYELEELLNWLDSLHDNLAIEVSKLLGIDYPELLKDLTKTLDQIVNEIAEEAGLQSQKSLHGLKRSLIDSRRFSGEETEVVDIMNKILTLNKRLERLQNEDSVAVMALQHKKLYMEERLRSIENIKKSLITLKSKPEFEMANQDEQPSKYESRIFDHNLPEENRSRLVEELISLWRNALGIAEPEIHSIISILSASCLKETYQDAIGNFTVDKYGRKIYKKNNDDTHSYQLNEKNELVPVNDDEQHVYFYDDCGRYFKDDCNDRIYKANSSASEYLMNRDGMLMKVKEIREGHEYFYDDLGKYYKNEDRKRIYVVEGSDEKFENDGFGNLVRIHDGEVHYHVCKPMAGFIDDSQYVHDAVGQALRECIAAVVAVLPEDPISYLASCLEKYRANITERQKREEEKLVMAAERERSQITETKGERLQNALQLCNTSSQEEEYTSDDDDDYNIINYNTPQLASP